MKSIRKRSAKSIEFASIPNGLRIKNYNYFWNKLSTLRINYEKINDSWAGHP